MEHFVIIVNDWNPLTIITNYSILDAAAVLEPPLEYQVTSNFQIQLEVRWLFTAFIKSASAVVLLFTGSLDIAKKHPEKFSFLSI